MADAKNLPSYECPSYVRGKSARAKMRDLQAGTQALRDKAETYLPKREREKREYYELRRKAAILFNATDKTHRGLVGLVFRKEPVLSEDVPPVITEHLENVDLQGTHWTVFAKELFSDAMLDGHSFVYVDMPPPLGDGATLADEIAAERRPYWLKYTADQVINLKPVIVNNRITLGLAVIRERIAVDDGLYGQKDVTRYRVLRPGSWELYEEKTALTGGIEQVRIEGGRTSLDYIPLFATFGRQAGWMTSTPPLSDLADHNIGHYQLYSDYRDSLRTSIPVFVRESNNKKPVEVLGPYTALDVEIGGKIYFAEPTGTGIEPHRKALEDLKNEMAVMGLSLLVKRTAGDVTATEELIDKAQEESDLATAARSLKDCLENCLMAHADYLGLAAGGSVEIGASLSSLTITDQRLATYSNMVAQGQLSLETMWAMMAADDQLPEDFDPDEERERLATGAIAFEEPINAQEEPAATDAADGAGNPIPQTEGQGSAMVA